MKKIILLSIVVFNGLYADVELDRGEPTMEQLAQQKRIILDVKNEELKYQKHLSELELQLSQSDTIQPLILKDIIEEKNINLVNLTGVYDLGELEVIKGLFYHNKKIVKSGFIKTYYENIDSPKQQIKEILSIQNGYVSGTIKEYDVDGSIKKIYQYVRGKKEGYEVSYSKGKPFEITEYKNGEKNGLSTIYTSSGKKLTEMTLRGEDVEGFIKYYFPSGSLKKYTEYHNNIKDGIEVEFNEQHRLLTTSTYTGGLLNGFKMDYNPDGVYLRKVMVFQNGKILKTNEFNKYGKVINTILPSPQPDNPSTSPNQTTPVEIEKNVSKNPLDYIIFETKEEKK
jgi:antitoxin component YwqK of YwqJK toxin-antitoxin module